MSRGAHGEALANGWPHSVSIERPCQAMRAAELTFGGAVKRCRPSSKGRPSQGGRWRRILRRSVKNVVEAQTSNEGARLAEPSLTREGVSKTVRCCMLNDGAAHQPRFFVPAPSARVGQPSGIDGDEALWFWLQPIMERYRTTKDRKLTCIQ